MAPSAPPALPVQPLWQRLLFGILTAITGYLIYRCLKPPAQTDFPDTRPKRSSGEDDSTATDAAVTAIRDRVVFPYMFQMLRLARTAQMSITTWQSLFIIFPQAFDFGVHRSRAFPLNTTILTANWISVPVLLMISATAGARMWAYASLGSDFTFDLRPPQQLNTKGIYSWVQHPSYSSAMVAITAGVLWFARVDGPLGLFTPEFVRRRQHIVHGMMGIALPVSLLIMFSFRVRDEEAMLHRLFGHEWEVWHHKTARFIPGVI